MTTDESPRDAEPESDREFDAMSEEDKPTGAFRRWGRRVLRVFLGALSLLAAFASVVIVDGWRAFGVNPDGARRTAMEASPHFRDGIFHNTNPMWVSTWLGVQGFANKSEHASPSETPPVVMVGPARFAEPPRSGLRITWLGHSTLLLEQDGHRVLMDPVWGERTAPVNWLGPERWYAPPLALADVPSVDAVVLSHDHYDHLDYPTIRAIKDWDTTFIAPLGVTAHLEYWGVPSERIVELDWWDRHRLGDLTVVMTPARHASGRQVLDQNRTLWGGFAFVTDAHRVFYSGDTGLFPGLADIGERLGPFDVTMLEVGAYDPSWPDWHLGPEQAVRAHQMLRGERMLPVHWGLFDLANHGWTAPIERTLTAAAAAGVEVMTPRAGESVEPGVTTTERWWPVVPYRDADALPIVARGMD